MSQYSTGLGRPRMGTIRTAVDYSGISRSKLYILAGRHPGLFKKFGRSTIVDLSVLDTILDGLPPAEVKTPTEGDSHENSGIAASSQEVS